MARNVKFPIRAKLFVLMSTLVLAATAAYLALATRLFTNDKKELVYELNASNVNTLASQIDATLSKFSDKARLLTQGHRDADWVRAIFESEGDLVAYSLYVPAENAGEWRQTVSFRNPGYLKLYGLSETEIERIRELIPVPFTRVLEKNSIAYNSTLPGGAPILTLAFAVEISGSSVPRVAVVDIRLDSLLKLLGDRGVATVYVVDHEGRIAGHPDPQLVNSRAIASDSPIVKEAVDSSVKFQMKPFEVGGDRWLGAYASVPTGQLRVISQVSEKEALRAASTLLEKSLLFGAIVLTLSMLVSGWLAGSLTAPLHALHAATEKMSRWEFPESLHIRTRDEISALARSFNAMAADLMSQRTQLENQRKELEVKVRERTAALEEEKKNAAQIQESLIRTTRLASLGELAGVAAHEILNPINNINIRIEVTRKQLFNGMSEDFALLSDIVSGWRKSYGDGGWDRFKADLSKTVDGGKLLIEEDLANLEGIASDSVKRLSEQRETLDFLSKEVTRVSRIVNNMRALSRVGGERRPVDLHGALDETISTFADQMKERQMNAVREFGDGPVERFAVVADKDELVQVFSNLLRNSMQAIESAGRRAGVLRVRTERKPDRVEIRFTDNGGGISPENLSRIFEPNFTTKTLEKGTGLGLSISRRIVRAFGGDLQVESTREGEGTTFLIWLPAPESVV